MNKKNLLLAIGLLSLLIHGKSQEFVAVDLSNSQMEAPAIDFYVLDVMDGRKIKNMIGLVNPDEGTDARMLKFEKGFSLELIDYLNESYPIASGKSPLILNFTKLWVRESEQDDESYIECEIQVMMLTPKRQLFHEASEKKRVKKNAYDEPVRECIALTLKQCMKTVVGVEIIANYYNVLNSDAPAISSVADKVPEPSIEIGEKELSQPAPFIKYVSGNNRIALSGGYTYRIAKLPEGIDNNTEEFIKQLKNGYHLCIDLNFFFDEVSSLGFTGSFSNAIAKMSDVSLTDENGAVIATGDLSEDVKLFFLGLTYLNRKYSADRSSYFFLGLNLGYYGYDEDAAIINYDIDVKGETLGFGLSLGFDFLTADNFALGIQASGLFGWLDKMRINGDEVELSENENLSRIDFTVGIRFLP